LAGDWIAVRCDLERDPAVVHLARELKAHPRAVVGHLVATWGWFDSVSRDGHAPGVTGADLDKLIGVRGWSRALQSTPGSPWLELDGEGYVVMPNADRWQTQTGKERLLATRRKAVQRARETMAAVTAMSRSNRDSDVNTGQYSTGTTTTSAQQAAPEHASRLTMGKAKKKKLPPNPEHQPAIDFWCTAFERTRRTPYAFSDRDGQHVKRLLERADLETFKARATALLESTDPFYAAKGCDLGTLSACWNRLAQAKPPRPSYDRPAEPEPAGPVVPVEKRHAALRAALDAANGRPPP